MTEDFLEIAGEKITSRLFAGTGKFGDNRLIRPSLEKSGARVVTVALRRVEDSKGDENILNFIPKECIIMTNTSGARTAEEAIRIARLAIAAGMGPWIKIEVISDNKYLLPDNDETLKAVEILAKENFVVLPYMTPDLYAARRMANAGAAALMPLGAPIGSNRGLKTRELVRIMIHELKLPVIVDAGLGMPSEAAECMEMGCGAVLVNTAIATAKDPVEMAVAFSEAVRAGRRAFFASSGYVGETARASSPLTGFLRENP